MESEISGDFGVSHGTVRAAFRYLVAEGLLEYRPRRGMFVVHLQPEDAIELYSFRSALESMASQLAAEKITPLQDIELSRIINEMSNPILRNNRRACVEIDFAFHRHIIEMSGHKLLKRSYMQIEPQIRLFMALTEPLHANLFSEMRRLHEPIFDAIVARNSNRAAKAAALHNRDDGEALASALAGNSRGQIATLSSHRRRKK